MKLGLFLMPLHRPERLHAETYEEDLDLMAFADDLGYSETWVGEHFNVPWENMPSPELFIARALGVTKQMSFGIGVAQLHYHNPIHVAHRIAMLDHMSRGRIYLGIGSTGAPIDMEMFGVDPKAGSPRERMEEAIEVILRIWRAEPFEHRGRFFNATLPEPQPEARLGFHMTPYQTPHPPIAVAGSQPYSQTLAVAGERGWLPLSNCFLHPAHLPSHWEVVEKGGQKTGRKTSRSEWRIAREVFVAEDGARAREEMLRGPIGKFFTDYWVPVFKATPTGLARLKHDPDMPDEQVTAEYMLDQAWIVGSPDDCEQQIRRLHDDVGGFGTLLLLCHDWEKDRGKWLRSLELMSREVLPALGDLRL